VPSHSRRKQDTGGGASRNGFPSRLSGEKPLLLVDAFLNDKGPFVLAVDTGASMTILSPTAARRARAIRSSKGGTAKAVSAAGHSRANFARLDSLVLGPVRVSDLEIAIVSLAPVSRAIRHRLDGVLGYNFLRRYRVTIDYPEARLFLAGDDAVSSAATG
jgi:hypothetical protein